MPLILPLLCLFIFSPAAAQQENIDGLINNLQHSLREKDVSAYLENFHAALREDEERKIRTFFERFQLESASLFKARRGVKEDKEAHIYLKVLFQSHYAVVIENWQLALIRKDQLWRIKEKKLAGEPRRLYKLKIPSPRAERVRLIEIEHVDINLIFRDAAVFYDNIPELETALLIIGNGHLHFSPSDKNEKHQLEMLYKKKFLKDKLHYVYLRFSDYFFHNHIRIVREEDEKKRRISEAEMNEAYSLFVKHYPRSFTIENSLNGELLSFLPQGDETVFEFDGRKIGKFSYIYSPFAREEVNLFQWKEEKIVSLYSPAAGENKKKLFLSFGRMFDVQDYIIDIAFDPEDYYLSGKAKIGVKAAVPSLDGVKFKFHPDLEILRIFDEQRRELFYTQDKLRKILYVYFLKPPSKGETSYIEIYYRGKLVPPKQIADVVAVPQFHDDALLAPSNYDTYLYSQSSYWYPSPPDEDYFRVHLKIIIPPDYACVSNGVLVEKTRLNGVEKVEGIEKIGNSVYVFKSEFPVKYISFLVGKLTEIEKSEEPLPLAFLKCSRLRYSPRWILDETREILRFYQDKFGPYPYEKLTIVQRIWPTSGGHSPASFIVLNELPQFLGKRNVINSRSPVDFSRWKEYFIAHEIAHQWWGQGVTWKTYHDQWLSEGLAQFSSILYLREKYGDGILPSILKKLTRWTEKKSEWGAITMGSRLSYFDFKAYQSIIYGKSSLVLNMLKEIMGEEMFFEGLRKFFDDHKYGGASTHDFIRTFKEISDYDLTLFFKGWFDSHQLPEVKVKHSLLKRGGKYLLRFTVAQRRNLFVFPLWVEWKQDGKEITRKLLVDKRESTFDFELDDRPTKIKVDTKKAVPGEFD
ncbi:MAG: M1 family metallopeptidase [Candidatus Aminicenantes bacterium]